MGRPSRASEETALEQYEKDQRIVGQPRVTLGKQLLAEYNAGASIRNLKDKIGRSYGFVHKVLAESGAVFRPRGGPRTRRRPTASGGPGSAHR